MDIFDRATELETLERNAVIQRTLGNQRFDQASKSHCIECEEAIPERRRQLGGVDRCTDCQRLFEQRNRG